MAATRTILSPNHYAGWTKGPPRAIVVHSTRSGQVSFTDAQELQATINWFSSVNSQASAHWVISEVERVRMVEDKYPAWHAVEHSWEAYRIEVCQPTRDRPYKEGHYKNLVSVCVPYVKAGIPVVHLPTLEAGDSRRGFVGHEETEQGLRDGKSDPGPPFDWPKFISMLKAETEEDMALTQTEFNKMFLAAVNNLKFPARDDAGKETSGGHTAAQWAEAAHLARVQIIAHVASPHAAGGAVDIEAIVAEIQRRLAD